MELLAVIATMCVTALVFLVGLTRARSYPVKNRDRKVRNPNERRLGNGGYLSDMLD
ncbi:MAG: hypothetical protein ACK5PP_03130 [Acidimicrobiales bacterium]